MPRWFVEHVDAALFTRVRRELESVALTTRQRREYEYALLFHRALCCAPLDRLQITRLSAAERLTGISESVATSCMHAGR